MFVVTGVVVIQPQQQAGKGEEQQQQQQVQQLEQQDREERCCNLFRRRKRASRGMPRMPRSRVVVHIFCRTEWRRRRASPRVSHRLS
jgi:hypothetical protein